LVRGANQLQRRFLPMLAVEKALQTGIEKRIFENGKNLPKGKNDSVMVFVFEILSSF
jgi:hypothetical protein